jgi:monoamine oxidase
MIKNDILVIGAGMAGLMAAAGLSRAGLKVQVLEARDRVGGRVHSISSANESAIELGPEFIHSDAPFTMQLMQKTGLKRIPIKAPALRWKNGILREQEQDEVPHYGELVQRLEELNEDIGANAFLNRHFSAPEYEQVRKTVREIIEGYELADMDKAAILAMRGDLTEENEDAQLNGRYACIAEYLAGDCMTQGCTITLSTVVTNIEWAPQSVTVTTADGNIWTAGQLLITVPLGVLQAKTIAVKPELKEKDALFAQLGFGNVIKVVLEFSKPFWKDITANDNIKTSTSDFSFIFSDAPIPTWWRSGNNLLTGWLGGTKAERYTHATEEEIQKDALQSLAMIFSMEVQQIEALLKTAYIPNWNKDPFSHGAYSYATVGSNHIIRQLKTPVEDTIFFAGEAMYEGPSKGTVEAALVSAVEVVKDILQSRV